MADSNDTPPLRLTAGEMSALANRLHARASSIFLKDMPELQRDCLLAARALRGVVRIGAHAVPLVDWPGRASPTR